MVGNLSNNLISATSLNNQDQSKNSRSRRRNGPDDNVYADEATPGQTPSDETKLVFELLRAGLVRISHCNRMILILLFPHL